MKRKWPAKKSSSGPLSFECLLWFSHKEGIEGTPGIWNCIILADPTLGDGLAFFYILTDRLAGFWSKSRGRQKATDAKGAPGQGRWDLHGTQKNFLGSLGREKLFFMTFVCSNFPKNITRKQHFGAPFAHPQETVPLCTTPLRAGGHLPLSKHQPITFQKFLADPLQG